MPGMSRIQSGSSTIAGPVFVGELREFAYPGMALLFALVIRRGELFMRLFHPVERSFIIALPVPDKRKIVHRFRPMGLSRHGVQEVARSGVPILVLIRQHTKPVVGQHLIGIDGHGSVEASASKGPVVIFELKPSERRVIFGVAGMSRNRAFDLGKRLLEVFPLKSRQRTQIGFIRFKPGRAKTLRKLEHLFIRQVIPPRNRRLDEDLHGFAPFAAADYIGARDFVVPRLIVFIEERPNEA